MSGTYATYTAATPSRAAAHVCGSSQSKGGIGRAGADPDRHGCDRGADRRSGDRSCRCRREPGSGGDWGRFGGVGHWWFLSVGVSLQRNVTLLRYLVNRGPTEGARRCDPDRPARRGRATHRHPRPGRGVGTRRRGRSRHDDARGLQRLRVEARLARSARDALVRGAERCDRRGAAHRRRGRGSRRSGRARVPADRARPSLALSPRLRTGRSRPGARQRVRRGGDRGVRAPRTTHRAHRRSRRARRPLGRRRRRRVPLLDRRARHGRATRRDARPRERGARVARRARRRSSAAGGR